MKFNVEIFNYLAVLNFVYICGLICFELSDKNPKKFPDFLMKISLSIILIVFIILIHEIYSALKESNYSYIIGNNASFILDCYFLYYFITVDAGVAKYWRREGTFLQKFLVFVMISAMVLHLYVAISFKFF